MRRGNAQPPSKYVPPSARSYTNSSSDSEDERRDTIREEIYESRLPRYSNMQAHSDAAHSYNPQRVNQPLVHHGSTPFQQPRESRDQRPTPKPMAHEQYSYPSNTPNYVNTASAGPPLPYQQPPLQSASYANMNQLPGNIHSYSSNPQMDQFQSHTPYGYSGMNQMSGYGPGFYSYMQPGGTGMHFPPYVQPSNPPHYHLPMPRPPSPASTHPTADPPPPPDREKLKLKEELKMLKEFAERAKEAEARKQMEERIRIEVEVEFQHQMELTKKAQEQARAEIERIRTEAEREARERIMAERRAQAEREHLETQQAICFERELRSKIERERLAAEAAKEARERQREEFEKLMREKMLQNMEELTAMAKEKMILELSVEKEASGKMMDNDTNPEILSKETSIEIQGKEMFQGPDASKYQTSDAAAEEQEVSQQSFDTGYASERASSTSGPESQQQYEHRRFKPRRGNRRAEQQKRSPREDMESIASSEHSSNASVSSSTTHTSFGLDREAHWDEVLPHAPEAPGIRKSSSGNSNSRSSEGSRSRGSYNNYDGYPMDGGQYSFPEHYSYQEHRQYQERRPYQEYSRYQEHYPYQEYSPYEDHIPYQNSPYEEHIPYQEHRPYQEYRHYQENHSYPESHPYPAPMSELVEQVVDSLLNRLAGHTHRDTLTPRPSSYNGSSPRVRTVSTFSPSDSESTHSEAATLQSQSCESTRSPETSISDRRASSATPTKEGGPPLLDGDPPEGLNASEAQVHADNAVVAASLTADETHTPTDSDELAVQGNLESSIDDEIKEQDAGRLEPSSEPGERPAFWRRPTIKCQLCGHLAIWCRCSSAQFDTED